VAPASNERKRREPAPTEGRALSAVSLGIYCPWLQPGWRYPTGLQAPPRALAGYASRAPRAAEQICARLAEMQGREPDSELVASEGWARPPSGSGQPYGWLAEAAFGGRQNGTKVARRGFSGAFEGSEGSRTSVFAWLTIVGRLGAPRWRSRPNLRMVGVEASAGSGDPSEGCLEPIGGPKRTFWPFPRACRRAREHLGGVARTPAGAARQGEQTGRGQAAVVRALRACSVRIRRRAPPPSRVGAAADRTARARHRIPLACARLPRLAGRLAITHQAAKPESGGVTN
jgi:hypothetical protein